MVCGGGIFNRVFAPIPCSIFSGSVALSRGWAVPAASTILTTLRRQRRGTVLLRPGNLPCISAGPRDPDG